MPPVVTGQQFPSFSEFKKAVACWSIEAKFAHRIDKSDSSRVIKCRVTDCPFLVRAYYDMEEQLVTVGLVKAEHISYGAGELARTASSKHSWLVENLPNMLTIDNKTTPSTLSFTNITKKYQQQLRLKQNMQFSEILLMGKQHNTNDYLNIHKPYAKQILEPILISQSVVPLFDLNESLFALLQAVDHFFNAVLLLPLTVLSPKHNTSKRYYWLSVLMAIITHAYLRGLL